MVVFDSYAWVEYFLGSAAGKVVRGYLDVEDVATPSIVLAEVARKYLREGVEKDDITRRLNFVASRSTIIEIDVELSLAAAEAYIELLRKSTENRLRRPSLADGIVLATGRVLKAKVVTGDEHFRGLADVVYIG